MRSIVFLLGIFGFVNCCFAESEANEKHNDWDSRIAYTEDQIAFRALTTFQENNDYVVLTMDRDPKDCSFQFLTMNVALNEPNETTYKTENLFGALRVDEYPAHDINFTLGGQKGGNVIFVTVVNFDRGAELDKELSTGQFIRFKLKLDKASELYFRFSLNGYDAAQKRTSALCTSYNQLTDKKHFEPEKKAAPKSDASYF